MDHRYVYVRLALHLHMFSNYANAYIYPDSYIHHGCIDTLKHPGLSWIKICWNVWEGSLAPKYYFVLLFVSQYWKLFHTQNTLEQVYFKVYMNYHGSIVYLLSLAPFGKHPKLISSASSDLWTRRLLLRLRAFRDREIPLHTPFGRCSTTAKGRAAGHYGLFLGGLLSRGSRNISQILQFNVEAGHCFHSSGYEFTNAAKSQCRIVVLDVGANSTACALIPTARTKWFHAGRGWKKKHQEEA